MISPVKTSDPTRLAILARGLRAIADEMCLNLIRSAFSTVVREARDCSTALLTPSGQVVAQAEMLPIQTAALSEAFRCASEQLDLTGIGEDHALMMNDPYSGGQHLNDIIIFTPIMHEGHLIGWSGSTAHHLDIGGGSAGINTTATELIQEGLIIPPLLLDMKRDWNGGMIERLVMANIRTAEIGLGDINAQLAANFIGRERVLELVGRYGTDAVAEAMEGALDYSERRMVAAIGSLPKGSWDGEAYLDRDVFDDQPVLFKVKVTIDDDGMELDFAGSASQIKSMFNCPYASSMAAAITGVRSIFADKDIPANDGCNRPLRFRFPEGTVVNPRKGAPVRARMTSAARIVDAIHAALAKAVPDRVPGQGFNTTTGFYMAKPRGDGTMSIYADVLGGGYGGAKGYDGVSATDQILSSCRITPIESIEQVTPHLLMRGFGLTTDSGGAGEFNGGLGFSRQIEILEDGVLLSIYSDRYSLAPKGRQGGTAGGRGGLTVLRDGETLHLASTSKFELKRGDLVSVRVGGGGGWGDPSRRDQDAIRRDMHNGLITPEYALREYGLRPGDGD